MNADFAASPLVIAVVLVAAALIPLFVVRAMGLSRSATSVCGAGMAVGFWIFAFLTSPTADQDASQAQYGLLWALVTAAWLAAWIAGAAVGGWLRRPELPSAMSKKPS